MKQTILAVLFLSYFIGAQSQSLGSADNFKRFQLSLNIGMDNAIKSSTSALSNTFSIPNSKRAFAPGINGAYFFTKNYGVGFKFKYILADEKTEMKSDYLPQSSIDKVLKIETKKFDERIMTVGPALFGRWQIADSKWNLNANAGAVYLQSKLSGIDHRIYYFNQTDLLNSPDDEHYGYSDHSGNGFGFTASVGISYQVLPCIGIGLSSDGIFGSISKMKYKNVQTGNNETASISRKINRLGAAITIDYSF